MPFTKLGLSGSIINAVTDKGYKAPSAIQEQSIPVILDRKDLMASAQTGTGKTASFTLPILDILHNSQTNHNKVRALILVPTRELAAQVHEAIEVYGQYLHLRSAMVYGGTSIKNQKAKLSRGVDILVATPGRLLDLVRQRAVKLDAVEILVLDEADRMLDMGFIPDMRTIVSLLPNRTQNLLFSATFSRAIRTLAEEFLKEFVEINTTPKEISSSNVSHKIHAVDKLKKTELLTHLISENNWYQALVFCRTKHGANKLVTSLNKSKIKSLPIHGNKSQSQRMKALADFKAGKIQILVATDVAARGIDIHQLPHVINMDLPDAPEDYVHRIGRTGRAGEKGEAISLVSFDEKNKLFAIERILKQRLKRESIPGFEPERPLPEEDRKGRRGDRPQFRNARSGRKPATNRDRDSRKAPTRDFQKSNSFNQEKPSRNTDSRRNADNDSFRPRRDSFKKARANTPTSDASRFDMRENAKPRRTTVLSTDGFDTKRFSSEDNRRGGSSRFQSENNGSNNRRKPFGRGSRTTSSETPKPGSFFKRRKLSRSASSSSNDSPRGGFKGRDSAGKSAFGPAKRGGFKKSFSRGGKSRQFAGR